MRIMQTAREDDEQMALMEWAERSRGRWPELRLLLHIPNGGSRGVVEAARFKAMGVKAGVPDLFLPAARCGYHGLWIELKRAKGGRVSPEQMAWLGALEVQGYAAKVCHGWEEAAAALKDYLEGRWKRDEGSDAGRA